MQPFQDRLCRKMLTCCDGCSYVHFVHSPPAQAQNMPKHCQFASADKNLKQNAYWQPLDIEDRKK